MEEVILKEKIYTIPVNDAFNSDCECPICSMRKKLEESAVEFTMGPSYMEDDIRAKTDEMGFCEKHMIQVYNKENRLGFALVMKTHLDKVISDIENISKEPVKSKGLFKKAEQPQVCDYINNLNSKCFVCEKIEGTFQRYIDTVLYLYKSDMDFKTKYENSKGFCTTHYGLLIDMAKDKLSGNVLNEFISTTNKLYLENMKRVRDDVEWFINKFDHKYADEPWKNAKDSLVRAMVKDSSILQDE